MRILYLHGVASSGASNTAKVLAERFGNDNVYAPDLEFNPTEAYAQVMNCIRSFEPNVVVGTSLGGFYASLFGGPIKVLINPLLSPDEKLVGILGGYGKHPYVKPRSDGATEFEYTKDDDTDFRSIRHKFVEQFLDRELIEETYALFGRNDEVVDDSELFRSMYGDSHLINTDSKHRLTDAEIEGILIPLLDEISLIIQQYQC